MASVSVSPKQQDDLVLRQAVYPIYITQQRRSAVQILCIARHCLLEGANITGGQVVFTPGS
jgi:hypothetical protein